jgi:broad specificity phosphatase PhoE
MLVLITYSQTKHQVDEIWTGDLDTELSPDGILDAETCDYFGGVDVTRAYAAPQQHIQEFAKKVLVRREWETLPELRDRRMGTIQGRAYRETMAEFPRRNWLAWQRSFWTAAPEGESFFDISDRVLTAFRTKILPIAHADRVAIIAAPDVLRIIIGYLTKTEEVEVPKIAIEPCIPHVLNGDFTE